MTRTSRSIVPTTLALALLWIAAAMWRPGSTYHLAPVLIVGAGPLLTWGSRRAVIRATGLGIVVVLATSLILAVLDLLRGPSLQPFENALVEALVFAGATSTGVLIATTLRSRRSAR